MSASGEMEAVKTSSSKSVPSAPYRGERRDEKEEFVLSEKEREVAKQSAAHIFDRLVEVNLKLHTSVSRLVRVSYGILAVLLLHEGYAFIHELLK